MMTRDRSFRAAAPAFIRNASGLLVPDRSLDVRAARHFGFKSRVTVFDTFEQHAAATSGNTLGGSTSVATAGLTTTRSNCILLAFIAASGLGTTPVVTGVSGAGLTWASINDNGFNGTGTFNRQKQAIWWAKATNPITSQAITASFSPTAGGGTFIYVVAISGADTVSSEPFDSNVASIKVNSNASASLTAIAITGVITNRADTIQYTQIQLAPTGSALIGPGSPTGFTTASQQVASPDLIQTVSRRVNTVAQNNTITSGAVTRAWWGMSTVAVEKHL